MNWWRWLSDLAKRREWKRRKIPIEVDTGRFRLLKPTGEPGPGEADDIRVPRDPWEPRR